MRHFSIFASLAPFFIQLACATSVAPPARGTPTPVGPGPGTAAAPATAAASSPASATPTPSKAGPAGALCGGIAGFGCAAGLYCAFPIEAHCGAADQSGVCKPIPEVCTEQHAPVCGCNDKTYSNECYAARESVSVGIQGECATAAVPPLAEAQLCGTRGVQGECGPGLYCKYRSACGATDSGGTCTRRPQMCTRIYRPVCGCDGKTYGSDCVAASAGVAIAHDGECKK
jgi:hypothetical protein